MPGKPGFPNLSAMCGRRKGGAPTPQPSTPQGIAAHADAYLANLAARAYSQASIDAHRWALRQFTAWTATRGMHDPAAFTRADLEAYQHFLHHYRSPRGGKPLVTNTQLARLGCIRRFFAWLCRTGTIPANPAADLDLPRKQARRLPKALDENEIQRLLAIPNPADPFGLRDRTILELFYATGIRRSEMAHLDHGDYDPSTRTLLVRKGKNGKDRMLPVGERAAAWLDRFLVESRPLFEHLPQETALFLTGYGERFTPAYLGNWIKKLLKRCGIDKPGSCHLWRHSCATDMHRGGADIRYVQEMLGHERMETTQIYTHVHIDALREVHARCHPHGKLGPDRDMYGPVQSSPPPAAVEDPGVADESSFQAAAPVLIAPPAMNATAPSLSVPAEVAAEGSPARRDTPPDEEPPAGSVPNSPAPPPKPPTSGNSHNPMPSSELQEESLPPKKAGVTFYGYRWYDPVTGRWPSRDPIGEQGGINLYAFVGNDGALGIDAFGLYPYTTKEDAIEAASMDVWLATANSSQMGLSEYSPDLSEKNFGNLFRGSVDRLLSQGDNHMSGYAAPLREIRTIYGVEYWTFVCCDETETWSYSEIKLGRLPNENEFLVKFELGISEPTLAEWQEASQNKCTFVHSHNILISRARFDINGTTNNTFTGPSALTTPDNALAARFGIEVIAVSDDNFWNQMEKPKAFPRAIPVP